MLCLLVLCLSGEMTMENVGVQELTPGLHLRTVNIGGLSLLFTKP